MDRIIGKGGQAAHGTLMVRHKDVMARPKKMADVLSELLLRRGYAREQSGAALDDAWQRAAGQRFAGQTRVGQVKRGALEVIVASSTVAQELNFQKTAILSALATLLPDERIANLRCRVGRID